MNATLKHFLRHDRGNVALMFGIVLVPLLGFVAAAVDYARAANVTTQLQAAVDATTLAISKLPSNTAQSVLTSQASAMVKSYISDPDVANSLTVTPTRGVGTITVSTSGSMQTKLVRVIGIDQMNVGAASTAVWGGKLRVALVLDNTGSMASSGKMTALKAATNKLLLQLKNTANQDGDVYVSIVPFAKDVNVGPSNYREAWIKWSDSTDAWDQNNGSCSRANFSTMSQCVSRGFTWTPDQHSTWNGCVMDRDQSYDTTNTPPTGSTATLFPAEQYDSCPVPLMGLTYDWTALGAKVSSMNPLGGTNQAIGLQWGYQSLTSAPFTIPPVDQNVTVSNAIVLLTDGLNTQDRWYGNGSTPSTQVDARQKILCDNIKRDNIKIYAVQVNTDGDPTSTLLQGCASDLSKFFLLTSASQIITTFDQIGVELSALRISK